jgi:hypothetical protein
MNRPLDDEPFFKRLVTTKDKGTQANSSLWHSRILAEFVGWDGDWRCQYWVGRSSDDSRVGYPTVMSANPRRRTAPDNASTVYACESH